MCIDGAAVSIRRPGQDRKDDSTREDRLVIAASPVAVRDALAELRRGWAEAGLDAELCGLGELVLAEVLNNVVEHAQAGRSGGKIALSVRITDGRLACDVRDDGRPMPGGALPAGRPPELATGPEALPEGGFGWGLIRTLAEDLRYVRCDGWNHLRFCIAAPGLTRDA